jgi:phosphinothricin acetyltransferase
MLSIRPMTAADADDVLRIYQDGIDTGQATFEAQAPSWAEFDSRRLHDHRLVAVNGAGAVLGWVAVSPVSSRPAYAGVVEHGVYIDASTRGQGVGTALLGALIASTEAAGIWMIQSAVFPENTGSLALHQKAGFRIVGTRERIARHYGKWRDTVLLERRSAVIS